MISVNPYLFFEGNCEEAFNFYKSVFRKDFKYLGRYKDVAQPDRQIFRQEDDKIMHVSLPISEETTLMGADNAGSSKQQGANENFSLYITTDDKVEADRLFNELSAGGEIKVPMMETFWGSYYGTFKDKFGIGWKISVDLKS